MPTLDEAFQAYSDRNRRQGLVERILRLRYAGWSHSAAMALLQEPRNRPAWADAPRAWALQRDLHEHGIQPPTSNRRSGRKRAQAKAVPYWQRNREV